MKYRSTGSRVSLSALAAATCLVCGVAEGQFGGFQRTDYTGSFSQPEHMALGDLDGDGDLDIASTSSNSVRIKQNNGDGTIGPSFFASTSVTGGYIIIADYDDTNGQDLCIVDRNRSQITIMLNDGAGSFLELPFVSLGLAPFDGVARDFDGDGDLDLAIVSEGVGEFTVALNDGSGNFTPLTAVSVPTSNPEDIAAADLDGDGDFDIAVLDRISPARVLLYTNDGAGVFVDAGLSYSFPSGPRWAISSADINQDGLDDFLVSSFGVVAMLNNGDGTLSPQPAFNGLGSWAQSVFAPDLDGDGTLDVVVGDVNSQQIHYAFGNGDGSYNTPTMNGTSGFVSWTATGDMDGNGTQDIVAHTRSPGEINVFINQTAVVVPGNFDLTVPANNITNLARPEAITGWQINAPRFRWTAPTGFGVLYDLTISTTGPSPTVVYTANNIDGTSHAVPTGVLAPGREYEWDVAAVNPIGITPANAPFRFTVTEGPNPCPADQNNNGSLEPADFSAWIFNYNIGCP